MDWSPIPEFAHGVHHVAPTFDETDYLIGGSDRNRSMPIADRATKRRTMTIGLRKEAVVQAYGRWAPIYDMIFDRVFRDGRRAAVDAAEAIGGRILEVGVGTGLSLPGYAEANFLVGVDISAKMLRKARERVAKLQLENVAGLAVMDAESLGFPDSFFDVVVAQYVVTAVPIPERALDELARVLRPGGEIVITSRIGAEVGLRATIEKRLMPVTSRLGWRTEFPLERYLRWAAGVPAVRLVESRPIPPFGHFSLIRFAKFDDGGAPSKLSAHATNSGESANCLTGKLLHSLTADRQTAQTVEEESP
jgi:phosphatidylethanolamine/phosphatidyl-N-methylethanolamine N-methyltransferase